MRLSRSLAEQGAQVAAGYSGDQANAQAFVDNLGKEELNASIHQGNVGSADDCRPTVNEVIEQHGRLDILINNAGITIDKTVLKMTDEDWYKVLAVNLSGAFFMSQAVLPHMIERGSGRIINISSIIGEMGNIGQANYAASKSGLFGLTKTMAREAAYQLNKAGKLDDDARIASVGTRVQSSWAPAALKPTGPTGALVQMRPSGVVYGSLREQDLGASLGPRSRLDGTARGRGRRQRFARPKGLLNAYDGERRRDAARRDTRLQR